MDNLTHTLIGVTIANAGLKNRFGRGTTLALAIASNIPDIDILGGFFHDGPSHLYRRMLTHSLFALPILSAALAAGYRRFFPNLTFRAAWGLWALGMLLHVFFDLVNSYGVVLLYPLRHRFELASVFIIDLALWALMLAPLALMMVKSQRPKLRRFSQVSAVLVAVYVAGCLGLRGVSSWGFNRFQIQVGLRPTFSYVFPEPFGPFRFRGVIRKDDIYRIYQIKPLGRDVVKFSEVRTQAHLPNARRIVETDMGRDLSRFFKAPVMQLLSEPGVSPERWVMWDLRFGSTLLKRENLFRYGFEVSGEEVTFVGRVP